MNKKILGLIVSPGEAEKKINTLLDIIPKSLKEESQNTEEWRVQVIVDPLTGAAESVNEIFQKMNAYSKKNAWDAIVGITDLPIFYEGKVVNSDINEKNNAILISLPSLGWKLKKSGIKQLIVKMVQTVNKEHNYVDNNKLTNPFNGMFPKNSKKVRLKIKGTDSFHTRFILDSKIKGYASILIGMTFINNPFTMLKTLSGVLAIGFTTGAFGMAFTTMWQLSYLFSEWRLLLASLASILGMLVWITISHNLWELPSKKNKKKFRKLYNLTTILTLLSSILIFYFILFISFSLLSLTLLPPSFLGQTLGIKHSVGVTQYLDIAWFASSLATVVGAIGIGLTDEEVVLESTYGYRQKYRYIILAKRKK